MKKTVLTSLVLFSISIAGSALAETADPHCLPKGKHIPISGKNVLMDFATLRAGKIPATHGGDSQGVLSIVGEFRPSAQDPSILYFAKSSLDGTLRLEVKSACKASEPQCGRVDIEGSFELSELAVKDALQNFGLKHPSYYSDPYAKPVKTDVCLKGIAIDAGRFNSTLYDVKVFLYFGEDSGLMLHVQRASDRSSKGAIDSGLALGVKDARKSSARAL
jgi:hypothetical protein